MLVSVSTKTWGNGLGAVVELGHKNFLGGFSTNYLFFFTKGNCLHLPVCAQSGRHWWYFNLLSHQKERGL